LMLSASRKEISPPLEAADFWNAMEIDYHYPKPRLEIRRGGVHGEAVVRSLRGHSYDFPNSPFSTVVAGVSLHPAASPWIREAFGVSQGSSSSSASSQASSQPMAARGSVRALPDGDVLMERMQLMTIQPGTLAYHGTFEANVEGIAENGICRMSRSAIHLFSTWEDCCTYTRGFEAIACVDLGACHDLGIEFVIDRQTNIILSEGILGIIPTSCVENICRSRCRTEILLHRDHRVTKAKLYSQKLEGLLDVRDLVEKNPKAYPDLRTRSIFEMVSRFTRGRSARGRLHTDAENLEAVPRAGVSLDAGNRASATALRARANAGLSGDSLPIRVGCLFGVMRDAQKSDAFMEGLQKSGVELCGDILLETSPEACTEFAELSLLDLMAMSEVATNTLNSAEAALTASGDRARAHDGIPHCGLKGAPFFKEWVLYYKAVIKNYRILTHVWLKVDDEADTEFDNEEGCLAILASFQMERNVRPTTIPEDTRAAPVTERAEELIVALQRCSGRTPEVAGPEIEPELDDKVMETLQEGGDNSNPSAPQGSLSVPAPPPAPVSTERAHAKNVASMMCGKRGSNEFSSYTCTKQPGHEFLESDSMCCNHRGQSFWGGDLELAARVLKDIEESMTICPVQKQIYDIAERYQQSRALEGDAGKTRA
jgi:hypothetical protein